MATTMSELTLQQLLTVLNVWIQNVSVGTLRDVTFIILLGFVLIFVMKNSIK